MIGTDDSLAYFDFLRQKQSEYQATFGESLEWLEQPGKKQKIVRIQWEDADPVNRDDGDHQHAWIHDKLERMHHTFSEAAKSLDPADCFPEQDE